MAQTGTQHPFGNDAAKTEYMVKKQTTGKRKCQTCHGTGINNRGQRCADCIEGVSTVYHTTEVDLITALKELNLIK